MKYLKFITIITALILLTGAAKSQDVRTVETKVADLLAQMPSKDAGYTEKLMNDMLSLGDGYLLLIMTLGSY